jgi:S-adenosylhomocysteine hydrolase
MSYFQEQLPLMDMAANNFEIDALEDAYVIACQHILPSSHRLFHYLFDLGLKKERLAVIGKCYSTSPLVDENMRNEGIFVCPTSKAFDGHASFDQQFQRNIRNFLALQIGRMRLTPSKRIIILDDGGELLKAAGETMGRFSNVMGVEQTSSGYNKLKCERLAFPIVNVARSRCKLQVESPMIAASQISIIKRHLAELKQPEKRVLIIGNGAIGQALHKTLRESHQVTLYDCIPEISTILSEHLDFSRFNVIIGTTGEVSLPSTRHHELMPGTILFSASSSDREFDAHHLRRKIKANPDCHADLDINGVKLINSGFPVNFYATDYDNVPLQQIQLTFGLLLAGVCQKRANKNAFVEVNERIQDQIIEGTSKLWLSKEPRKTERAIAYA